MRESYWAILGIVLGLLIIVAGELTHAQKMREVCAGHIAYEWERAQCHE